MITEKISNGQKVGNAEEYFEQNAKFFGNGDSNGKKAFFCLGQYTKKVMDCHEKSVAETGGEDKFQKKLTKLATSNMTYRVFNELVKLMDIEALICNPKIFQSCSGVCKQYLINSDFVVDKKALAVEDANNAFSLGLYQQF